jgi:hypothetical protein
VPTALPGTLDTGFSKKIEKQPLPTAFDRGSQHRWFKKKNETPSLPTARARGRRQRRFQKPSTQPAVNGYFFGGPLWALGIACAESLELGCSTKSRGREKILCEPCAERDCRQRLCRWFYSLCRAFLVLGKSPICSSD